MKVYRVTRVYNVVVGDNVNLEEEVNKDARYDVGVEDAREIDEYDSLTAQCDYVTRKNDGGDWTEPRMIGDPVDEDNDIFGYEVGTHVEEIEGRDYF